LTNSIETRLDRCRRLPKSPQSAHPDHFEHATIDDEIVADLLVKSILLRRLTKDRLATFIIEQIKPFMTSQDSMFLRRNIPTFSDFT
jgi:hypothetical protein